ncbi:MAG TPA: hypothetical protein DCZ56_01690 [Sutterella sp.]|nr:hypothetical protein [Sutterella sp.]
MRFLAPLLLALPVLASAESVQLTDVADDLYRVGNSNRYVLTRSCNIDGENLKADLSEKSVRFDKRSCEVVALLSPWEPEEGIYRAKLSQNYSSVYRVWTGPLKGWILTEPNLALTMMDDGEVRVAPSGKTSRVLFDGLESAVILFLR